MKCRNCGNENPEDSVFCQYCGKRMPTEAELAAEREAEQERLRQQQYENTETNKMTIDNTVPTAPGASYYDINNSAKNSTPSADKNTSKTQFLIIAVLGIALVASLAWGVSSSNKLATLQSNYDALQTQSATITQKYNKALIERNSVYGFLASADAGFSSNGFKASKPVVVVKAGETGTFTLTTSAFDGVQIGTSVDSKNATFEFAKNSWQNSVTINVKGIAAGTTICTFSNNQNKQTFRVMAIVI